MADPAGARHNSAHGMRAGRRYLSGRNVGRGDLHRVYHRHRRLPCRQAPRLTGTEAIMRALWLALLVLAAVPLVGCDAVGAMFSAALWIPGLFLVLLIWFIAFVVLRVRGS